MHPGGAPLLPLKESCTKKTLRASTRNCLLYMQEQMSQKACYIDYEETSSI